MSKPLVNLEFDENSNISKKTKAGVFIIESLDFEDESENKEGEILYQILQMSGIPVQYYYVRSYDEFSHFLDEFVQSNLRFLHISCHGDVSGIKLTLEIICNEDLGSLLRDKLRYRRLFLSACEAVNIDLAKNLFPQSGCNSLVGPNKKVKMNEIAIFWASFYHLMFKVNNKAMKKKDLIENIAALASLYKIPIKYFKTSNKDPFYTEEKFTQVSGKPISTDFDFST